MTQPGLFDVGEWVLAQDCLSPKLQGGWHVFYWHGPADPTRWTQDPSNVQIFPSPEAALGAWAAHVERDGSSCLARKDVRAVVRPAAESCPVAREPSTSTRRGERRLG